MLRRSSRPETPPPVRLPALPPARPALPAASSRSPPRSGRPSLLVERLRPRASRAAGPPDVAFPVSANRLRPAPAGLPGRPLPRVPLLRVPPAAPAVAPLFLPPAGVDRPANPAAPLFLPPAGVDRPANPAAPLFLPPAGVDRPANPAAPLFLPPAGVDRPANPAAPLFLPPAGVDRPANPAAPRVLPDCPPTLGPRSAAPRPEPAAEVRPLHPVRSAAPPRSGREPLPDTGRRSVVSSARLSLAPAPRAPPTGPRRPAPPPRPPPRTPSPAPRAPPAAGEPPRAPRAPPAAVPRDGAPLRGRAPPPVCGRPRFSRSSGRPVALPALPALDALTAALLVLLRHASAHPEHPVQTPMAATQRVAAIAKNVRRRPTLPPSTPGSTIGADRLSFRVRNGTGRFPVAMTAVTLSRCPGTRPAPCGDGDGPTVTREPHSGREHNRVIAWCSQVIGLLVPVSFMRL